MHDQTTSVQSYHLVYMLCYSLAKHARFCEPGIMAFSRRHFNILFFGLVQDKWGNWWGSRQLENLN